MNEKVVKIGHPIPLFGILTEPSKQAASDTAVILLNSGVMHHVGSCRLTVTIARAIAKKNGLLTLRFDFSGIGDSPPRRENIDFYEAVINEVREVMDFLTKSFGIKHFILYGLCSGARVSYRVGQLDSRVKGIIQIDGLCFPTWKSYFHHYNARIFSAYRWKMRLTKFFKMNEVTADMTSFEVQEYNDILPKSSVSDQLAQFAANKIHLCCIFTHRKYYYSYLGQYKDCFNKVPLDGILTEIFFKKASHIMPEPAYQQLTVEKIVKWIGNESVQKSLCSS